MVLTAGLEGSVSSMSSLLLYTLRKTALKPGAAEPGTCPPHGPSVLLRSTQRLLLVAWHAAALHTAQRVALTHHSLCEGSGEGAHLDRLRHIRC